jgi:tetratricopeptide (TPR) repeat protein
MASKKKRNPPHNGRSSRPAKPRRQRSPASAPASSVRVRQVPGTKSWELVHPPCARERAEDIEEVETMIAAGELEIANDELRWLLGGCGDFVVAHRLLGEIALAEGDLPLARGHFGYAYEISVAALQRHQCQGPLPYARPANQAFFEAAKGLAFCLNELGHTRRAREVLERIVRLDPADPLGLREMLAKLNTQPTQARTHGLEQANMPTDPLED